MTKSNERRVNKRRAEKRAAKHGKSWAWRKLDIDTGLLDLFPVMRNIKTAYANDVYIVQCFDVATNIGLVEHLMIRTVAFAGTGRGDEPPWRDMQRIKDELCGESREAVQVYPRRDDVMDQVDMYHLWVLPPDFALPFGLHRESGFARAG